LTQRSEFFRAARSEHWITKPDQPTMLDDHEPATFSLYLHCVTFGAEALDEHIDAIAVVTDTENDSDSDNDSDGDSESHSDSDDDSDSDSGGSSEDDGGRKKDCGEGDAEGGALEEESSTPGTDDNESSTRDPSGSGDAIFSESELVDKRLVDLYLLADKLLDPTTANMAIDKWVCMVAAKGTFPSNLMIIHVYRSTTAGSPLRRLIRDWHIHKVNLTWAEELRQMEHPREFMEDIIIEMVALQRDKPEGRTCNLFSRFVMDGRPKDHYHQKLE
jgi:hypothetical protein